MIDVQSLINVSFRQTLLIQTRMMEEEEEEEKKKVSSEPQVLQWK